MKTRSLARKGFTLIEVLVATVIMAVLVGLVIQVTNEVLKVWNRASGKLSANYEARIALELLTQDIETAIFRNNGLQWMRVEQDNIEGLDGYKSRTVKLKLFSPALDKDADEPGEVCGIGYKLDFRDPVTGDEGEPGDRTFILYRNLVSPEDTFNDLLGPDNQQELVGGEWSDEAIRGDTPEQSDATQTRGANYLAGNIIDFQLDFYIIEPVNEDRLPPEGRLAKVDLERTGGQLTYGGTRATVGPQSPVQEFRRPLEFVEITLRVLSDEGMQILQQIDQGLPGSGYDDVDPNTAEEIVLREHATTFKRQVYFQARPL